MTPNGPPVIEQGLDPYDPTVVAAIDLVRWEM
jgi:hypothetical protein